MQVEFWSHFSGKKSASYGPKNTVPSSVLSCPFKSLVPKGWCADCKGSANGSQWICGYISIMATLTFTCYLIKGITFVNNNREVS